jgi:ABC-type multidrug transport system fused ATPase/permease subunit
VVTEQKKYFKPMAIVSIVIMSISLFVTLFAPIFDLMLIFSLPDLTQEDIISRVMLIVVLFLFLALTFLPTVIEDHINKRKGILVDDEVKTLNT